MPKTKGKEIVETTKKTSTSTKSRKGKNETKKIGGGSLEGIDLEYTTVISNSGGGFAQLVFFLKPDQHVISDGGNLAYIREGVNLGKTTDSANGGVISALGRMFSGESIFLVKYMGLGGEFTVDQRKLCLASAYPGDVLPLRVGKDEQLIMNRGSFIAASPNIDVSGSLNWRGIFELGQEEGAVLPRAKCVHGEYGLLWMGSYGSFDRHDLEKGQSIIVDNGLFLAAFKTAQTDQKPYELVNMGDSIFSTVLGGEGLGMKFVGPQVVFTQSHNFNNLVGEVQSRIKYASKQ